jgi:ribosomal protein S18 acetylase RimI-like enzyme
MDTNTHIRQATPADAHQAVILLDHAIANSGESIFGNGNREKTLGILERLFVAGGNRFNYRYTFVIEKEKKVAGLLLAFRSNLLLRLNLLTGQRLLQILKPLEMIQLIRRVSKLPTVKEVDKDEFYISDLAVAFHFRGQMLGTRLLTFAEELAAKSGLKRCSLLVTHENEGAKRLYFRNGYKIVDFIKSNQIERLQGRFGFYRMVKEIQGY